MTQINQNSTNLRPKPKAPLVLFIICILILVGVGGYFVYARSLDKTAESNNVAQVDQMINTDKDDTANTIDDNSTTTSDQIPADWKEYTLTSCGIKISVPSDWEISGNMSKDKFFSLISPNLKTAIQKNKDLKLIFEGPFNDIEINCYNSLADFTKEGWALNKKVDPNITDPINLFDALTRKGIIGPTFSSIDPYPINGIQDAQEVEVGNKKSFVGFQIGTPGAVLTYYFENNKNGKIISFESEMTEYQKKVFNEPHLKIIEDFQWIN